MLRLKKKKEQREPLPSDVVYSVCDICWCYISLYYPIDQWKVSEDKLDNYLNDTVTLTCDGGWFLHKNPCEIRRSFFFSDPTLFPHEVIFTNNDTKYYIFRTLEEAKAFREKKMEEAEAYLKDKLNRCQNELELLRAELAKREKK